MSLTRLRWLVGEVEPGLSPPPVTLSIGEPAPSVLLVDALRTASMTPAAPPLPLWDSRLPGS